MTESPPPDPDEDRLTDLSETRVVIEQAKGILMASNRCGPGEAWELLRGASQASGVKVHVLAAKLVELARRGQMVPDLRHHETLVQLLPQVATPRNR